jgi:DNA-binding CsgD family transcriptional regulator
VGSVATTKRAQSVMLLEREREQQGLSDALSGAKAGRGNVTLVEGVAGIGKTSLLAELRGHARSAGFRVLSARGAELELGFPYGVVRQLFELPLRSSSADERAALLEGAAGLAGQLLGLSGEASGQPASDFLFAVLNGLYWLTVNLADRGPVLLVIDDAHWSDGSSLAWLTFLRARIDELPVAVVLATRPEHERRELAQLAVSDREVPVVLLRPAPLTTAACTALTRSALGADAAPEFCEACRAATGGNPFLLRELLAGLLADRIAPSSRSASIVGAYRSDVVARWVVARLSSLGSDAVALATAVSILGVEVPLGRAGALAHLEPLQAAEAADRLAAAGIVQPGRPLTFVHAILAAAVHDELGQSRRGALHREAARVLADEGAPGEQIAAHLLVTEPAGEQGVVTRLTAAAEEATSRGAPESARAYLTRALAEPPALEQRPELVHGLGRAAFLAGDPSAPAHLLAAHGAATTASARAAIALDLSQYLIVLGRLDEAFPLLEDAIDELGDTDEQLAARLEVWLTFTARMQTAHAGVYRERIARLRAASPEDSPIGRRRMALLVDALISGDEDYGAAIALAERAFAGGELLDELGPESPLFYLVVRALAAAGAAGSATRWCDAAIAQARAHGSLIGFGLASCSRAVANVGRGALADAEADARAGLAVAGAGSDVEPITVDALATVLLERGELDEAEQLVLPVAARCDGTDQFTALFGIHARARLRIAQGDPRGGLDDLTACRRWLAAFGISARGLLPWASEATLAQLALGDREGAGELARLELAEARRLGEPRILGRALRVAGLIERDLGLLRESVEVLTRSEARLEQARALVDLGAALRRAGHRTDARPPLSAGLDLADRCGASLLAVRAREELVAAGARPRRQRIAGVDSLTVSERRIARMANDGMTNREIAQALFLTPKTVAYHLTHAYQKLDISGRDQLAGALSQDA